MKKIPGLMKFGIMKSIEGGVYFIFGDLTGFSNYVLLTSNKRGEYEDPNWQSRIGTVPGSSNILGKLIFPDNVFYSLKLTFKAVFILNRPINQL